MDTKYYYQASDELATALRDYRQRRRQFVDDIVTPWEEENPALGLWVDELSHHILGFLDKNPKEEPPRGLSRASTRQYLVPRKRGEAGAEWHKQLEFFRSKWPLISDVLWTRFGVPLEQMNFTENLLHMTCFADFNEDGVVIVGGDDPFSPLPAALTPLTRSEFYRLAEKHHSGKTKVLYR